MLISVCAPAVSVYLMKLWQGHRLKEPIMMTSNFAWCMGSTLSPLLVKPFLVELLTVVDSDNEFSGNLHLEHTSENWNLTHDFLDPSTSGNLTTWKDQSLASWNQTQTQDFTLVRYAYMSIGLICIGLIVPFFVAYMLLGPESFIKKPQRASIDTCRDNKKTDIEEKGNAEGIKAKGNKMKGKEANVNKEMVNTQDNYYKEINGSGKVNAEKNNIDKNNNMQNDTEGEDNEGEDKQAKNKGIDRDNEENKSTMDTNKTYLSPPLVLFGIRHFVFCFLVASSVLSFGYLSYFFVEGLGWSVQSGADITACTLVSLLWVICLESLCRMCLLQEA